MRWGKERTRARFEASGKREGGFEAPRMPDEVEKLAEKFRAKAEKGKTGWEVAPATEILSLPGVGECVPDLVFRKDGQEVFLEVLGYWSRAAVWKRVELVEAGMDTPIVFAVSKRLRVSEEVLPEELPAALYVYKGVLSAKAVEERLDAAHVLEQVRERLGEETYEAFVLYYEGGLTQQEVADALERSRKTIRKKIAEAHDLIDSLLGK